jgi:hypothetical protein
MTGNRQSINVPTAGARAFLMVYTQGEWAITHHADTIREIYQKVFSPLFCSVGT